MKPLSIIFVIFISVFLTGFDCQAEDSAFLDNMVIQHQDNRTRSEFKLRGPVTPKVTKFKDPERIVIDFPGTRFGKPLAVPNPSTSYIENVKATKPGEGNLRFVFELKQPAKVKSYSIKGDRPGQQTLIVDLLPVSGEEEQAQLVIPSVALLKGDDLSLEEQIQLLTQLFESQQQKIKLLEAKVERQERLLAMRPKSTSVLPPPSGAKPMPKATRPAISEKTKRKPARDRGIETVLREEHAIFEHGFTLEPGFSYTRTDRNRVALSGFLVLDAIALGQISVDEVESDVLLFDLTGRYGLTERLQLDINIPFLYRSTTFRETAETGAKVKEEVEKTVDLNFELSDISFGFSYQLFQETPDWPDVVWTTRVRAPTGSHPFGIKQLTAGEQGNIQFPEKLPSGNGIWALTSGFSFVKSLDPAVVFASFSYSYNFEQDFDDISSKVGERVPGTIDLGNAFQFGLGFALALNESMSMSISYSHRFTDEARTRVQGGEWKETIGSAANSGQINFGLVYAITPRFSVIATVAAGLTNDAPDTQFSLKFPYVF